MLYAIKNKTVVTALPFPGIESSVKKIIFSDFDGTESPSCHMSTTSSVASDEEEWEMVHKADVLVIDLPVFRIPKLFWFT